MLLALSQLRGTRMEGVPVISRSTVPDTPSTLLGVQVLVVNRVTCYSKVLLLVRVLVLVVVQVEYK
jgi:hypothetical protein